MEEVGRRNDTEQGFWFEVVGLRWGLQGMMDEGRGRVRRYAIDLN